MYHLAKSLYLYATSKEEYSILLLGLDNAGKTTLLSTIKSIFLPDHPPPHSRTVPTVGQNVSTITLADMYLKIWDVGGQHSLRKLWQSYYRSCHAIVFVIDSSDVGDADLGFLEAGKKGGGQSHRRTASSLGGGTYTAAVGSRSRSPKEEGGLTAGGQEGGAEAGARGENISREHTGRLEECKLVLESVLASADTVGVPVLVLANKQDREDCVETVKIKEGLVRPVFEGERGAGVRDSRVLPVSALTGAGVSEAVEWVRSRVKWNKEGRPPAMR